MEGTSGRPSEAKDHPLVPSIGEGGAGGWSACEQFAAKRSDAASASTHDLPESLAITIVPPKGAKGASYASEGKDKAALADTALPSPAYRQEGAHVAAEIMAITIVPPKGAKGASYASEGKDKAALADTALPIGLQAEGRTLLPSRRWRQDDKYNYRLAIIRIYLSPWQNPLSGRRQKRRL